MNNWQDESQYSYTADLSRELWAWEFLRRNTQYQHEWERFITRWKGLEADYGVAPNRDFQQWKNDPRAFVLNSDEDFICPDEFGAACAIEDGKVLIECWLGAKWGFYKFPLDPEYQSPNVPDELLWREQEIDLEAIAKEAPNESNHHLTSIQFDLRLSLVEQLNEAKYRLAIIRRERSKQGLISPRIKDNVTLWTRYLRLLDAVSAGATLETAFVLFPDQGKQNTKAMYKQAMSMSQRGYLHILLMR